MEQFEEIQFSMQWRILPYLIFEDNGDHFVEDIGDHFVEDNGAFSTQRGSLKKSSSPCNGESISVTRRNTMEKCH